MALKPGQEKCINTLDKPLVVAAGAGSGKTFTLTRRIVHALESGYVDSIDQVLAITFTNKAAGELKSRVKGALRACGKIEDALRVDEAWISTIHGMCARILRAHALELGIDPQFRIADELEAKRLRDQAIEDVLAYAPGQSDALDSLFREYAARRSPKAPNGASVQAMLEDLIDVASSSERGFDAIKRPPAGVEPARLLDGILQATDALKPCVLEQKANPKHDAWLAQEADARAQALQAMQNQNLSAEEALGLAYAFPRADRRAGSKDYKALAAEVNERVAECQMALRLAVAGEYLDVLLDLARAAYALFAQGKREAGVMDNNDLLVFAYRALCQHPSIAACYENKFKLVMVDEFQDTDQLQVDMIEKLSGENFAHLCVVGDAQQSIYRFRGADVSVFQNHRRRIQERDAEGVIQLPDNFRSHRDVLGFVDCIFERDDMFGSGFMSLGASRDEARVKQPWLVDGPRIMVEEVVSGNGQAKTEDRRNMCAQLVASRFAAFKAAGHSAGDMAVLLGGMKNAALYAQALRERGMACVITGGSVFSQSVEAQLVERLCALAANADDDDALYAVLASDLFCVSSQDLLALCTRENPRGAVRHRALHEGMRALQSALSQAEKGPAAACSEPSLRSADHGPEEDMPAFDVTSVSPRAVLAARVLAAFQSRARTDGVGVALEGVLADSGWLSRLEGQGGEGQAQAANALKAIRIVTDLQEQKCLGPAQTAQAYAGYLESAKEAPGALSASGGDFVRIMTVHSSKGLEFPIVAVAEFRDSSARASKFALESIGGISYVSLDIGNSLSRYTDAKKATDAAKEAYEHIVGDDADEESLAGMLANASDPLEFRAALVKHSQCGDDEEAKRLFYVALTRAKEALVVVCQGQITQKNPVGISNVSQKAMLSGLNPTGSPVEPGVSVLEYRPGQRACVHRVELLKGGEALGLSDDAEGNADVPSEPSLASDVDGCSTGAPSEDEDGASSFVPAFSRRPGDTRQIWRQVRTDVFSYSSVAEAAHEGSLLEDLARRFCTGVDAHADAAQMSPSPATAPAGDTEAASGKVARRAFYDDADAAAWDAGDALASDQDKATDFGTAFHRLAQLAARQHVPGKALACPSRVRVDALMRSAGLAVRERRRLSSALNRWFSSDLAADMAPLNLSAEVPFFIQLDNGGSPIYLEGEIDLLGIGDADDGAYFIVDYKTGGNAAETEDQLAAKHVLQATCYAYAALKKGARTVSISFVRVEQEAKAGAGQPQCVRYRFESADAPDLARAIVEAYRKARATESAGAQQG